MATFPSVINDFNVYNNGTKLIGVTGEVTLPDFESKTTTINGAGILGDIEETVMGQFNSMKQEIPFRTLSDDIFSIMNPTDAVDLTLRGAIQTMDTGTGVAGYKGVRVAVRGKMATFKPGTMKAAEQMNCSVTLELTYILIEVDGKKMVELDKLNAVYVVNGKDLLKEVRGMC